MIQPPPSFGRSVVVRDGQSSPELWRESVRHRIDAEVLADTSELEAIIAMLHVAWVSRTPVVLELAVADAELRVAETSDVVPWLLPPGFTFPMERLLHLVWANAYDARRDPLVWWWSVKAAKLGATVGGPCDVVLPGGIPAWIDGGPRDPLDGMESGVVNAESVARGSLTLDVTALDLSTTAIAGLAEDQLAAVTHMGGAARVIAPAGSGKTRTLAARMRHLTEDRGIEPELVTAVAYNNRAAHEMRDRLPFHLRNSVKTIHALGRAVLFSSRGSLRLLDERDVRNRIEPEIPVARRANTDIIGPYVEAFSDVRIGLRSPAEIESDRDDVPDLERVLRLHRRRMIERGECDFDEFVYGAIEVLLADAELRSRWQWACRHLLVDEFQDLTPGHLILLRLLASPALDVFAVGDDDQVIYGYAGADPAFLIDFERLFPGSSSHALETNYRCPAPVVEAAVSLLSYNHRRVDKTIRAVDRDSTDETPQLTPLEAVIEEGAQGARVAADRIEGWLDAGHDPASMAVLCRVNSALLPVHAALVDRGISISSPLDRSTLSRTVLAASLAWLRVATTKELHRSDLMLTVRRPSRGLTRLANELLGRRRSLALSDLKDLGGGLEGRRRDRWDDWCADIAALRRVAVSEDVRGIVAALVSDIGLDRAAAALDAGRSRADRAAQSDDLHALIRLAALHPDLSDFESWLRGVVDVQSADDGVLLTTIHRVKGLEWERVVVYGADRSLMPHALSEDVEEERRIFHVSITRGSEQVVVITDRDRPSPFIDEMKGVAPHQAAPREAADSISRPAGVAVEVGDEIVVAGGFRGVVERRIPTGVLVALKSGTGRLAVTWGESVSVGERHGRLQPGDVAPDADLVERIRAWRLSTARSGGVPAYVVLTDATIAELATRRPRTERELLAIKGIGPAKLEAYGDDLLDLCADG